MIDFDGSKKDYVYATEYDIFADNYYEEKIYTKKQLDKIITKFLEWDIAYAKDHPQFYGGSKIPVGEGERQERIKTLHRSLTPLVKVYREGKYHNPLCEYAKGDNCSCWCSEKYHGMNGFIPQTTSVTEGISKENES